MFAVCLSVANFAFAQNDTIRVNQGPAAPTNITISDVPNDDGSSLFVHWTPTAQPGFTIHGYQVYIARAPQESFVLVQEVGGNVHEAQIGSTEAFRLTSGTDYWVKVTAVDSTMIAIPDTLAPDSVVVRYEKRLRLTESAAVGPAQTITSFFNWRRLNILILILTFFTLVMIMVNRAKRGEVLKFRYIPGIAAIDEAIGRATELGKPVLYVPGTQNIENIQTIASIQLLTSISSKAATYDIPIIVPLNRAFMVTVAEEAVKQGFLNAGRPDAYNRDNIRYLSDEQFAFTSGVAGIVMRERTAAHFYLGAFYAESLILSEVGFSAGAIQIAGTANIHQLPFFVVACDYTLIGEEYFATSALVTGDKEMQGTLKATDWMKAIIVLCLLASMVLELFNNNIMQRLFSLS